MTAFLPKRIFFILHNEMYNKNGEFGCLISNHFIYFISISNEKTLKLKTRLSSNFTKWCKLNVGSKTFQIYFIKFEITKLLPNQHMSYCRKHHSDSTYMYILRLVIGRCWNSLLIVSLYYLLIWSFYRVLGFQWAQFMFVCYLICFYNLTKQNLFNIF